MSHEMILTGEAVLLEARPASVMTRALATFIDVTFHALVVLLLALGVFGQLMTFNEAHLGVATVLGIATVAVILPTAVETLTRGRSLGKVITGTWKKDDFNSALTLEVDGKELKVPAGKTFVELVPEDGKVTITP